MHKLTLSLAIYLLMSLIPLPGSFHRGHANPGAAQQPTQQTKPSPSPQPPTPAQDQDAPVRLSSRLVVVPVSASDLEGQPVKDLKVEDLVIEEEGRPQQVVALGEPGKTPVEIALLFDVSGSTHAQFAFEQQAAEQFIKEVLKPGDGVSLFSIGMTPKMVKARTNSGDEAIAGIRAMGSSKEPTAFFDSIVEATHYLNQSAEAGSRRVLVVISDGEENYSTRYKLADAQRELQKNDCLFYAINPSGAGIRLNTISVKGQHAMETMAAETGGEAFNLLKVEDLGAVFRQIANELQAQYLFGYYATDAPGGDFKRITVRAPRRPNLRIRARQGYYTAKP
ncbi:MAG: VWA domain-containing protein [Blastocatellia bacterium]